MSEIAENVRVTAGTVAYHLKNMKREDIVEQELEGVRWRLGPYDQASLTDFLGRREKKGRKRK